MQTVMMMMDVSKWRMRTIHSTLSRFHVHLEQAWVVSALGAPTRARLSLLLDRSDDEKPEQTDSSIH